jgi:hypothetical protein
VPVVNDLQSVSQSVSQSACLSVNSRRVHTAAVPVVNDLQQMYAAVDEGATAALLAKLAVEKSQSAKLEEARSLPVGKVTAALREFRVLNAAHFRAHNKLIYPEGMRHLLIWALGKDPIDGCQIGTQCPITHAE